MKTNLLVEFSLIFRSLLTLDHDIHPSKLNHYNVRGASYQVFQCFPVVQYFRAVNW